MSLLRITSGEHQKFVCKMSVSGKLIPTESLQPKAGNILTLLAVDSYFI